MPRNLPGAPRSQLLLALSRPLCPVLGPEPAGRSPRLLRCLPSGPSQREARKDGGGGAGVAALSSLRLWLQVSHIPCFLGGLGLGPSRHPCASLCVAVAGVRVACHLCPALQLIHHLHSRLCLFPVLNSLTGLFSWRNRHGPRVGRLNPGLSPQPEVFLDHVLMPGPAG